MPYTAKVATASMSSRPSYSKTPLGDNPLKPKASSKIEKHSGGFFAWAFGCSPSVSSSVSEKPKMSNRNVHPRDCEVCLTACSSATAASHYGAINRAKASTSTQATGSSNKKNNKPSSTEPSTVATGKTNAQPDASDYSQRHAQHLAQRHAQRLAAVQRLKSTALPGRTENATAGYAYGYVVERPANSQARPEFLRTRSSRERAHIVPANNPGGFGAIMAEAMVDTLPDFIAEPLEKVVKVGSKAIGDVTREMTNKLVNAVEERKEKNEEMKIAKTKESKMAKIEEIKMAMVEQMKIAKNDTLMLAKIGEMKMVEDEEVKMEGTLDVKTLVKGLDEKSERERYLATWELKKKGMRSGDSWKGKETVKEGHVAWCRRNS